jgi:hypothetical protein
VTYVITIYGVRPERAGLFVRSMSRDGEWYSLSRALAPTTLIATDTLRHEPSAAAPFLLGSSVLFVCIDFWISRAAYQQACQSPDCQSLFIERRRMAESAFEFGAFSFPGRVDAETVDMPTEAWN